MTRHLSRTVEFASALSDPGPAKIEELEQQRKLLVEEIARLEKENGLTAKMGQVTEPMVRQLLNGVVEEMHSMHR